MSFRNTKSIGDVGACDHSSGFSYTKVYSSLASQTNNSACSTSAINKRSNYQIHVPDKQVSFEANRRPFEYPKGNLNLDKLWFMQNKDESHQNLLLNDSLFDTKYHHTELSFPRFQNWLDILSKQGWHSTSTHDFATSKLRHSFVERERRHHSFYVKDQKEYRFEPFLEPSCPFGYKSVFTNYYLLKPEPTYPSKDGACSMQQLRKETVTSASGSKFDTISRDCEKHQNSLDYSRNITDPYTNIGSIHHKTEKNMSLLSDKGFSNKPVAQTHTRRDLDVSQAKQIKELCNTSKKIFLHQKYLNHSIETGEKPYKCVICNKEFARENSFKSHLKVHISKKPHRCTTCDQKFTCTFSLKRHMRVHTGEKPYQCTICDLKFTQKFDLKRHMRVHTGEKPYLCKTCNKKFTQKGSLKRHLRRHTVGRPCK